LLLENFCHAAKFFSTKPALKNTRATNGSPFTNRTPSPCPASTKPSFSTSFLNSVMTPAGRRRRNRRGVDFGNAVHPFRESAHAALTGTLTPT